MNNPELGQLVEVDLRMAWDHEAHSFTPWLAEHLDQLADKIGIPLELEGREVRVETFSADILARNPLDESLVLIENQLEPSDHNHLGQIMTYLAGLEAKIIIWIARDFRDAHISALHWLNDNTSDEFSFFAVQVKAVRIGDSPIAPVFDVVARPNDWERALNKIAKENSGKSEIHEKRSSFWAQYIAKYPDDEKYCAASGASHRWRRMEDIGLTIVAYLAAKSVGVYVRANKGCDATDAYEQLALNEPTLTEKLGIPLGKESDKYFFVSEYAADTSNRDHWDQLCDWLKHTADNYESTLHAQFATRRE